MRNEQHYRNMIEQNPNTSIGYSLAASMVYAARYGSCDAEHRATEEWKSIARRLKSEYGETVSPDDVSAEMDKANRSAAASSLGSIKSAAKSEASRTNGKLGGRPRKDK
jgi:hypothetical protein